MSQQKIEDRKPEGYRKIIMENLKQVIKKENEAKDEKEVKYWNWIKGELLSDLADYEGKRRWAREPYDSAFKKYSRIRTSHMNVDDIIRHFFDDFW